MENFYVKTRIIVERNLAEGIENILKNEGSKSILIFADEHVAKNPAVEKMISTISPERKVKLHVVLSGEPTTTLVNELVEEYQDWNADMIVAIGGGAVLDLSKAVSAMLVNPGKVEHYQVNGIPCDTAIKKIAVSTTAGTGCDISPAAVLINEEINLKRGIRGAGVGPEYALICAELGITAPPTVTCACALDAMAHALESYTCVKSNNFTKIYSKAAFVKLFKTLPLLMEDWENEDLREQMFIGSTMAGCAIANSGCGACHAMSYAPGIYFHVPHGCAIGNLFAETIKVNIEKGCTKEYAEIYEALGYKRDEDDMKNALALQKLIEDYEPLTKYVKTFRDYGINDKDLDLLVPEAFNNKPGFYENPVSYEKEDVERIYKKAMERR